ANTALPYKIGAFIAAHRTQARDARDDFHRTVGTFAVLRATDRPEIAEALSSIHDRFGSVCFKLIACGFDPHARHRLSLPSPRLRLTEPVYRQFRSAFAGKTGQARRPFPR